MRLRRPVLLLLSRAAVCACAGESRSVDSRQVVLEAGIGQSKADISETGIFLWNKGDSFTAFLTDGSPVRFSLEGSGGRSMASFSATLGSGDVLGGLAVYPEGDHRSGEDALTFNLPARSSVTGGGNRAPMVATFEEGAAQISFRQMAGLLRFVVRDVPVEASQFCVTAPGRRIVGDFPLKLSVADSLCTEESPSGNTVTLVFPRLKAPGTLTFSVPLPCGDYPSLEFGLRDAGGRVLTSAVSGGLHLMRAEVIDVAAMSAANEEGLYRMFGVDAELLIDHAWGVEPVRMCDIKAYCPAGHSFSTGQVLPRPYRFEESLLVFREMTEQAVAELVGKKMRIPAAVWWISFDPASLEENPGYSGPVTLDFYGRLHPVHTGGTVRFRPETNSRGIILAALDKSFREKVNPGLLVRRIGLSLNDPKAETGAVQTDMFTDPEEQDRERRIQEAMIGVRGRFGRNALVRGMSLLEGATAMERNEQIGGHRA